MERGVQQPLFRKSGPELEFLPRGEKALFCQHCQEAGQHLATGCTWEGDEEGAFQLKWGDDRQCPTQDSSKPVTGLPTEAHAPGKANAASPPRGGPAALHHTQRQAGSAGPAGFLCPMCAPACQESPLVKHPAMNKLKPQSWQGWAASLIA